MRRMVLNVSAWKDSVRKKVLYGNLPSLLHQEKETQHPMHGPLHTPARHSLNTMAKTKMVWYGMVDRGVWRAIYSPGRPDLIELV